MSPTPDSTLADPQQVIADLQRELAQLKGRLKERTAERDAGGSEGCDGRGPPDHQFLARRPRAGV